MVKDIIDSFYKEGCVSYIDNSDRERALECIEKKINFLGNCNGENIESRIADLNNSINCIKKGCMFSISDTSDRRISIKNLRDSISVVFKNKVIEDTHTLVRLKFINPNIFFVYRGTRLFDFYNSDFPNNLLKHLGIREKVSDVDLYTYLFYHSKTKDDDFSRYFFNSNKELIVYLDSYLKDYIKGSNRGISNEVVATFHYDFLEQLSYNLPLGEVSLFYYDYNFMVFKVPKSFNKKDIRGIINICLSNLGLDGLLYNLSESDKIDLALSFKEVCKDTI